MICQIENLILIKTSVANTHVEVFRTNVQKAAEAEKLVKKLTGYFPDCSFNFDLEDCDKILRAKGRNAEFYKESVIDIVTAAGHQIEVLPD